MTYSFNQYRPAMLRFTCLLVIFFSATVSLFSQEESTPLPSGVSIGNQLKYSYDTDLKREIFEDWFSFDYRYNMFSAGLRLESFQPNDPNTGISRGKERFSDIDFKYVKADIDFSGAQLQLTAGNYYALFGRGLLLKIYEDRNVRIDNNLSGILLNIAYNNLSVTALSGMPANSDNERKEILHGLATEYTIAEGLKAAAGIVSNQPEGQSARTWLYSGSLAHSISWADYYLEYGQKENEDIKNASKVSGPIGKAVYANLNTYFGRVALSAEYKMYDNFSFITGDGTVQYNTPPALRKDYSFLLLNRHPSALDASNEQGFAAELNYVINEDHAVQVYGSETKSLSTESLFKKTNNLSLASDLQLREIYLQYSGTLSDNIKSSAVLHTNEERGTNTKNYTAAVEARYSLSDKVTLRGIFEHQQTEVVSTTEKYTTDALTLEYLVSDGITLSWVSELETKSTITGKTVRKGHSFVQAGYQVMQHTTLSVLAGSRQQGYICIGGVCRYEPAFSGIEFKMITRL